MKSLISSVFLAVLLLTPFSQAEFLHLPDDFLILSCTDVSTGKPTAGVYLLGDVYVVGFSSEGKSASLPVLQTQAGFFTKQGSLHNLRLVQIDKNQYELSVYIAQLSGEDGEVLVKPTMVSCK